MPVKLWEPWYRHVGEEPEAYADTASYQLGADWLADCAVVEDWGCGKGWMRNLIEPARYRGIDGSWSRFADHVADLADYRSEVPGVFMRHVLEHDDRWAQILDNALASFTERMFLVLFTPLAQETHNIEFDPDIGVPNLSFRLDDLTDRMTDVTYEVETFDSASQYGTETVFRICR